jgi:hypothetical protein
MKNPIEIADEAKRHSEIVALLRDINLSLGKLTNTLVYQQEGGSGGMKLHVRVATIE